MSAQFAAVLIPFLIAFAQPAHETAGAPWNGQMQCGVTWADPADRERKWMLSIASDTTNMKLAISNRARTGDPEPLEKDESRELSPRKAKLEIAGLGGGEVEVTSYPVGEGRVWHDVALGHVEGLDKFPADPTLILTIGTTPPIRIEMRDFAGARAYLQRCLDP